MDDEVRAWIRAYAVQYVDSAPALAPPITPEDREKAIKITVLIWEMHGIVEAFEEYRAERCYLDMNRLSEASEAA